MANLPEKSTPASVPGVPAAKPDSGNVAKATTPGATSNPAPPPVLPVGNVEATAASIARANGLRGGRPRKDGLIPGSEEARQADNNAARDRMQRLRDNRKASAPLPPLPPAATPEPGATPSVDGAPPQTIPVHFPGNVGLAPVAWTPADLQPVVESSIGVGEAWDYADNKKIIAPLELDAAAQSRILQPTRWPEVAKLGLQRGGAESLAEIFNALGVPVAVKKHLLSLPSVALLVQHVATNKAELRKLVAEEVAKKNPPKPGEETKPATA